MNTDLASIGRLRFRDTQNRGLKIGIFCRTLAIACALVWYVSAIVFAGQEPRFLTLFAIVFFTAVGVAHYFVIGTRHDRWWMKYLLFAIDIAAICALFALLPISRSGDVPQIIAFRAYGIYYLFPLVVLASLSLSWTLVIWSGIVAAAGWWAAFFWVVSGMQQTLSWTDIPSDATRRDYESIFLSIDFVGRGNRFEETGLLLIAASILAVAVYRAREVFFAQVEAEEKGRAERDLRKNISDTFGRYVPSAVMEQLVESGGKIPPAQSRGSVLLLDIAGFTAFSADRPPEEVIDKLDGFLSAAADVVASNHGVVISYTGDGLLASFNAPLELDRPEPAAIATALRLKEEAGEFGFEARVGIASGDLVSGTIGSESRTAFTVYGATVNRAARLEALCKEIRQKILIDEATAQSAGKEFETVSVGTFRLRGASSDDAVYSVH